MKNNKKILALFLMLVMLFSISAPLTAQAAVKLSKTSVSIVVGKTYTLKVKGTKKKVKWSTSNKKIATVKAGKVTAKKVGKATITAKVGTKKYKCKVTVKPKPISVKNVKATYYKATNSKAIVAILKNNNPRAVSVHLSVVFYDAKGNIIDTYGDSNYCFEKGRTCVLHVVSPSNGYSKYKTKLTVDETYYAKKTYVKYVKILQHNVNEYGTSVLVENKNTSKKELDTIRASIVFYDADGKVVDYAYTYFSAKKAGEEKIDSFYIPYDKASENYERIQFASYKIYIDHAYIY